MPWFEWEKVIAGVATGLITKYAPEIIDYVKRVLQRKRGRKTVSISNEIGTLLLKKSY